MVRNANTGDFVQPAAGDQSAPPMTIGTTSSGRPDPIYVVARTDKVRIFVNVPEMEANHVGPGTAARVRVQALDDGEFHGSVTRTSWALNTQTRTLRAEIDLPNPDAKLLPGMYAYADVLIKREGVWAVPADVVVELGNQNCIFLYQDQKAIKTPVQTGTSDGKWTEIVRQEVHGQWQPPSTDDQIIQGKLDEISNGQSVNVVSGDRQSHDSPATARLAGQLARRHESTPHARRGACNSCERRRYACLNETLLRQFCDKAVGRASGEITFW